MSFFYDTDLVSAAKAGQIDLAKCDLRVIPVDILRAYEPMLADKTLDDIPTKALLGKAKKLKGVTVERGVLDADDIDLGELPWGARIGLVIYAYARSETGLNELLCILETENRTNGGQVVVYWDDGPNKIGRLIAPEAQASDT